MSERIVHMAGPVIAFHLKPKQEETRVIQRCTICGEKLLEKVLKKGKIAKLSFWDGGDWVVKPENGEQYTILPRDSGLFPKDSCAYLVEPEEPKEDLTDAEKEIQREEEEALAEEEGDNDNED